MNLKHFIAYLNHCSCLSPSTAKIRAIVQTPQRGLCKGVLQALLRAKIDVKSLNYNSYELASPDTGIFTAQGLGFLVSGSRFKSLWVSGGA